MYDFSATSRRLETKGLSKGEMIMNKVLKIDLTNRTYSEEELSDKTLDLYLGGRGLGAYLLYKNLSPGVDPLSPDNPMMRLIYSWSGSRG